MRLVGEDARPQRFGTVPASAARAALAFGANGEVGVVCAGLAGEDARLWVATGRLGGATRTFPAMGQSVSSAVIAGFARGAPIVAFRDRRGAFVAVPGIRRYHSSLIARASRYSASSPFNGAFGAAALEPGRHRRRAGRERRAARVRRARLLDRSPGTGRGRAYDGGMRRLLASVAFVAAILAAPVAGAQAAVAPSGVTATYNGANQVVHVSFTPGALILTTDVRMCQSSLTCDPATGTVMPVTLPAHRRLTSQSRP